MAEFTPTFAPKEYTPGGTYSFIYSIQTQIPTWNDFELHVLQSNGYNSSTPSTYCNTVVFGGSEAVITKVITYAGEQNYSDPLMQNPVIYQDSQVDMGYPVSTMFNGGATQFSSNMVFGQPVGDDYPSKIVVENDSENRTTLIKWYKNNELVNTDTITHQIVGSFAIGLVASGSTITGYAIIFKTRGSDALWTSGLKNNADVLTILNDGGYAGSNENAYGWTDDDKGDFVLSKMFDHDGYDATSGWVAGGSIGETVASCNADLSNKCEQYGGYIGTDIIEYMTGMSNLEGWSYLRTDAESDGLTLNMPSAEGHDNKMVWDFANQQMVIYDGETYLASFTPSFRTSGGSHVYLTYYRQSQPVESATGYPVVYMISASGYPQYQMYAYGIGNLEIEEFDNWGLLMDMIDGYDPNAGQEDDPQDEPEDVDDPTYDPLGSGFLYAFMVDNTDMTNLADALVPETLAQKIRADFGNNLFEFIVSYHMMPCLTNASSLTKMNIAYRGNPFTYGDNNTQLALAPITKSFYTVSCGSRVCMPTGVRKDGFENWAQANVQLYLPFIGYVHLNTADVWNKTITISYKFDILQGTCVANVGVGSNGTIYSFEGSCKYNIPFTTAIDKSNTALLSGIMSSVSVVGAVGGAVAGGSPMSLLGAVGSVADATGGFLSALEHKSIINRGGCLSGAPGWLMPRKPALIITVPNRIQPGMIYNDTNGYPVFETGYLNGYENNYVEVGQIGLKAVTNQYGATPNDSELDMIKTTLKGGVYV